MEISKREEFKAAVAALEEEISNREGFNVRINYEEGDIPYFANKADDNWKLAKWKELRGGKSVFLRLLCLLGYDVKAVDLEALDPDKQQLRRCKKLKNVRDLYRQQNSK